MQVQGHDSDEDVAVMYIHILKVQVCSTWCPEITVQSNVLEREVFLIGFQTCIFLHTFRAVTNVLFTKTKIDIGLETPEIHAVKDES